MTQTDTYSRPALCVFTSSTTREE